MTAHQAPNQKQLRHQIDKLLATANNPTLRHPYANYTLSEAVKLAFNTGHPQQPSSLADLRRSLQKVYKMTNYTWITGVVALELFDAEIDGRDLKATSQLIL